MVVFSYFEKYLQVDQARSARHDLQGVLNLRCLIMRYVNTI